MVFGLFKVLLDCFIFRMLHISENKKRKHIGASVGMGSSYGVGEVVGSEDSAVDDSVGGDVGSIVGASEAPGAIGSEGLSVGIGVGSWWQRYLFV